MKVLLPGPQGATKLITYAPQNKGNYQSFFVACEEKHVFAPFSCFIYTLC